MTDERGVRFDCWEDVMAFALTLPGSEASTSWNAPTVRVRGKPIIYPTREPDSFAIAATHDDKAFLIESDPDTFWCSDHFRNWPAVLVRYGSAEGERIAAIMQRAWWDRASKAQRSAFGLRP